MENSGYNSYVQNDAPNHTYSQNIYNMFGGHNPLVDDRYSQLRRYGTLTGLALIATVGRGMVRAAGTAARLFTALATQGISVRIIDQGSSELSIIVGVDDEAYESALQAIYAEFVKA